MMPVDGVMFCLQCGTAVAMNSRDDRAGPEPEDTTDPLLRKAIVDSTHHQVNFRLPISGSVPKRSNSPLVSIGKLMAAPMPAAAMVGVGPGGPVSARAPAVASAAPPHIEEPRPKTNKAAARANRSVLSWTPWTAGILVFGLFMALNLTIYVAFLNRVYPGVRVGASNVGGVMFQDLPGKLARLPGQTNIGVHVGSRTYQVQASEIGERDLSRLEREIKDVGHTTPLPVAGLVEALFSKPLDYSYAADERGLDKVAGMISADFSRPSVNAVPVAFAGQAFVVTEKNGQELAEGAVKDALRSALGVQPSISLEPRMVSPSIPASAYSQDVEAAEARMALKLQVRGKAGTNVPSPGDIAAWLVFSGPGKGVVADPGLVGAYIDGIPGKFDRVAATAALVTAINAGTSVTYAATGVNKIAPNKAVLLSLPLATYSYCSVADVTTDQMALNSEAANVLGDTKGWALGGRMDFKAVQSSCAFTLKLATASEMKDLAQACTGQSTCMAGSVLSLSKDSWQMPPKDWAGGAVSYHSELINHLVGQWLGFQHARCGTGAAAQILEAATVTIPGCSPNWYEIPADVQGTKPLPGF
jgi:hypothetical protein